MGSIYGVGHIWSWIKVKYCLRIGIRTAEKDIFERDRSGEIVDMNDPEFYRIYDVIHDTMAKLQRMNSSVMSAEEVRQVFADVTGTEVDDTLTLFPPFYMDFGKNLRVGKNVQHCCMSTFFDRCGITIGDNTFIAPKVNLITINHPADPTKRNCTYGAPITIGRNVWIGIASTVLPGVTIGDNSIVGANSVVTHDVPPNTIVAGSPARKIGDVPVPEE